MLGWAEFLGFGILSWQWERGRKVDCVKKRNCGILNCVSGILCRYVVCKGLKLGIDDVREYLFMVNIRLNQLRNSDVDVNLVVPLNVIKDDQDFYDYIVQSNEKWVPVSSEGCWLSVAAACTQGGACWCCLHCSAFAAREAKQSKGIQHRENYFMLLVNVWPLNVILLYRATTYFFFQWLPYHFDLCWWWSVTALGVRQVSFSCSINLPCRIMLMAVISLLSDWNFPLFQPLQNSDKGTS